MICLPLTLSLKSDNKGTRSPGYGNWAPEPTIAYKFPKWPIVSTLKWCMIVQFYTYSLENSECYQWRASVFSNFTSSLKLDNVTAETNWPVAPVRPGIPVAPGSPWRPRWTVPASPASPCKPRGPIAPVAPVYPLDPVGPLTEPVAPVAPVGPFGPDCEAQSSL